MSESCIILQRQSCPCACHEYTEGGSAPLILNLGTKWWQMVKFTPQQIETPGMALLAIELEINWAQENFWTSWGRKIVNWIVCGWHEVCYILWGTRCIYRYIIWGTRFIYQYILRETRWIYQYILRGTRCVYRYILRGTRCIYRYILRETRCIYSIRCSITILPVLKRIQAEFYECYVTAVLQFSVLEQNTRAIKCRTCLQLSSWIAYCIAFWHFMLRFVRLF